MEQVLEKFNFLNDVNNLEMKCAIALGALQIFFGQFMSFLRVSGSKGSGEKNSFFEGVHSINLLTAEWAPFFICFFIYFHFYSGPVDFCLKVAIFSVTVTRFIFSLRPFLPKPLKFALGVPSMLTNYLGFAFILYKAYLTVQ
eukprot:TRINITY_DN3593_c0_g1_i1.p1 TRINITY_DN3593_c0_g1~~TRINITY_DN3593_c0_g1_i1.p1  ORF type:complete len:142 (-),score=5.02 TRINITY_DN3593_c0_g1_i1:169-594(-)